VVQLALAINCSSTAAAPGAKRLEEARFIRDLPTSLHRAEILYELGSPTFGDHQQNDVQNQRDIEEEL
jgi:hypothetical protein